jgi:hypothetical protein
MALISMDQQFFIMVMLILLKKMECYIFTMVDSILEKQLLLKYIEQKFNLLEKKEIVSTSM